MNDQTSEYMEQIVERIKKQAEQAMREFDVEAERVQNSSSTSIDLFGGTAASQVVDIAADTRRVCDKLYATLQMLVKMVDEECKPLLNQQPSMSAVKNVADLIKWLNKESEIGTNFSASLNSKSLGTVVSGKYIPTMESKMIESYWETKYDTWDEWICDSITQSVPVKNSVSASQSKSNSAFVKTLESAMSRKDFSLTPEEMEYKKAGKRWREELAKAERERAEEIEKRVSDFQQSLEISAQRKYNKIVKTQTQIQEEAKQIIKEAQEKMKEVSIFKFSLRNELGAIQIKENQRYEQAAAKLEEAKKDYDREMAQAVETAKRKRRAIEKEVHESFEMPKAPAVPASIAVIQCSNLATQEAILAGMEPGKLYTISDMQREIPVAMDLSNVRITALIRQLIPEKIERVEKGKKVCFRLK